MSDKKYYIAVDMGAESGRVMLATLEGQKLSFQEMHRFANTPVEKNGELHWDFNNQMNQIKLGIRKTVAVQKNIQSIGIDTWGVDFGLIDANGELLENPYHYRDSRTGESFAQAFKIMPENKVYAATGIQLMQINSLFQLIAYKNQKPELLKKASKLLFMPNLMAYMLCGNISAEYTIASTSQLLDMNSGCWSDEIIGKFDLPKGIFPDIIQPGAKMGLLKKELADEMGCLQIPIIAVGCHDTACAVTATPADEKSSWAYLSSGTWSLLGVEIPKPVINKISFKYSFTNEGGVNNTIRLLKNIMGLWLLQQCRRQWALQGSELSYPQIAQLAACSEPFRAWLNVDMPEFLGIGNMPEKINNYLNSTGQQTINDKGQMARVILESLAVKYHNVINKLEKLTGKKIEVLHIVGGGSQNEMLNQFAADATGKKVLAGPIEATVLGNVIIQAMAAGQINSISQGRKTVAGSFELKKYNPQNTAQWQKYIEKFPGSD